MGKVEYLNLSKPISSAIDVFSFWLIFRHNGRRGKQNNRDCCNSIELHLHFAPVETIHPISFYILYAAFLIAAPAVSKGVCSGQTIAHRGRRRSLE